MKLFRNLVLVLVMIAAGTLTAGAQIKIVPEVKGDINLDGTFSIADVPTLIKALKDNDTKALQNLYLNDVNGDGAVDKNDVQAMARFLMSIKNYGFIAFHTDFDCEKITVTSSDGSATMIDGRTSNVLTSTDGGLVKAGEHFFAIDPDNHDADITIAITGAFGLSNINFSSTQNILIPAASHIVYADDISYDGYVEKTGTFFGSGTETDPYIICTTGDWSALATKLTDASETTYYNKYYRLGVDIDFNDAIAPAMGKNISFAGTFDGDGHKISNYRTELFKRTEDDGTYSGLFFHLNCGTIKNLWLYCNDVTTQENGTHVGLSPFIACISSNTNDEAVATVSNCHVYRNNTEVTGHYNIDAMSYSIAVGFGGIVGTCYHNAEITDCTNDYSDMYYTTNNTISFGAFIGGIIGHVRTNQNVIKIDRCRNNADLTVRGKEYLYAGGIVGKADLDDNLCISNCVNSGAISAGLADDEKSTYADDAVAGGIVGAIFSTKSTPYIYNCLNKGSLYAHQCDSFTGGIIGDVTKNNYIKVYNCASVGDVAEVDFHNPLCAGEEEESGRKPTYFNCSWTSNAGSKGACETLDKAYMESNLFSIILSEHGFYDSYYSFCNWKGSTATGDLDLDMSTNL